MRSQEIVNGQLLAIRETEASRLAAIERVSSYYADMFNRLLLTENNYDRIDSVNFNHGFDINIIHQDQVDLKAENALLQVQLTALQAQVAQLSALFAGN